MEDISVIEEAKRVAIELKLQNDRKEELLKREERLLAEQVLSGKSLGGAVQEFKHEETPKEYAQRMMRGDYPNGKK